MCSHTFIAFPVFMAVSVGHGRSLWPGCCVSPHITQDTQRRKLGEALDCFHS